MKNVYTLLLLFAFTVASETQFTQYGDLNKELLLLPESEALGGADLSFGTGATAGGSPANLSFNTMNSLTLSYANIFENTFSTSILSYRGVVGKSGGIGVTAGYLYIPGIETTNAINETENSAIVPYIHKKNASFIYIRTGYGHRYGLNHALSLSVGAAVNAIRSKLISETGYSIGLDAGVKLLVRPYGVSVALQFDNITTNYTYWNHHYKENAYPHLRIGLGWVREVPYIYGNIKIGYTSPDLLSNDGVNFYNTESDTNDQKYRVPSKVSIKEEPGILFTEARLGAEYLIMNRVALRAGIDHLNFTFGAGVRLFANRAGFDFAYKRHELAGTYQVSMRYHW